MSIFSKIIGKVASVAADFIPGGSLVKGGIKLAVPALASMLKHKSARGVGTALLGTGIAAGGATLAVQQTRSLFGGSAAAQSGGGLPALPGIQSGGSNSVGGGGGRGVMPVPQPGAANQFAPKPLVLDVSYARQYLRAPAGYVILRDPNGQVYCVEKHYARKNGWWKPARKPLLSATDSYHLKRNQQLIKKARKAIGPIIKKAEPRRIACAPAKRK